VLPFGSGMTRAEENDVAQKTIQDIDRTITGKLPKPPDR
jgi:hypothetical protein